MKERWEREEKRVERTGKSRDDKEGKNVDNIRNKVIIFFY